MVAKLATIGIVPGQDFDISKLAPEVAGALAKVPKPAQDKIAEWEKGGVAAGEATYVNGWSFTTKIGLYGTDYIQRAMITWFGLGANLPEDAIYPTSTGPDLKQNYNGANKYVMHFDKGQLPPVNGFWSITMYNA